MGYATSNRRLDFAADTDQSKRSILLYYIAYIVTGLVIDNTAV